MTTLKLKLQVMCGECIAMGPGKADLLDAIATVGSIAGAGRAMGVSYRRAWQLVDVMNRCWGTPLVETLPGNARGGGARLTPLGQSVLDWYRTLQAALPHQIEHSPAWQGLVAHVREAPLEHQSDRDTSAKA